ncbi:MAG: hypothetical protein V2J07_06285 [Anaerolineae bacterium]|jgi:hypothetical protein|nr:hypothetical protein [Anaerolineae bacterium]
MFPKVNTNLFFLFHPQRFSNLFQKAGNLNAMKVSVLENPFVQILRKLFYWSIHHNQALDEKRYKYPSSNKPPVLKNKAALWYAIAIP